MRGVSNPFLILPTNRAAKPGVHRSGYGPPAGLSDIASEGERRAVALAFFLAELQTVRDDEDYAKPGRMRNRGLLY